MPFPFLNRRKGFEPRTDIPSLHGKVILVTGGNTGLGKQTILELARHNPSQIWLTARSSDRAKAAIDEIQKQVPSAPIKFLELDLASLKSVTNAAESVIASSDRLDVLVLNAGIMGYPPGLTEEGFEIHFGTNHVGHALLVKLLMPILLKTAGNNADAEEPRVVCLSSDMHHTVPHNGIQFDLLKTKAENMGMFMRYGQSKLANILFARQLAKQYPQLKVASVHPGIVNTNLSATMANENIFFRGARRLAVMFIKSVEEGAKNQLWAATSKDVLNGEYYEPVGVAGRGSSFAKDDKLAEKLWAWTEVEVQGYKI